MLFLALPLLAMDSAEHPGVHTELIHTPIREGAVDLLLLITNDGDEPIYIPTGVANTTLTHKSRSGASMGFGCGSMSVFPADFTVLEPGRRVALPVRGQLVLEPGENHIELELGGGLSPRSESIPPNVLRELGSYKLLINFE